MELGIEGATGGKYNKILILTLDDFLLIMSQGLSLSSLCGITWQEVTLTLYDSNRLVDFSCMEKQGGIGGERNSAGVGVGWYLFPVSVWGIDMLASPSHQMSVLTKGCSRVLP